jgi:hypothetical protein
LPIRMMAQGKDLWNPDEDGKSIVAFRIFVQHRILPLMSFTHRVEGFIRGASLCAATGQSERMRSAVAVVCSSLTRKISKTTQLKKCQATKRPPCGEVRVEALLEYAADLHTMVSTAQVSPEDSDRLRKYFLEEGLTDKHVQIDRKVEKFANANQKAFSVTQRIRGVDVTSAGRGMVQCSKLKAALHREHVIAELRPPRGIEPEITNWHALKDLLKEADEWLSSTRLKPRT